jgi:CheY-like chemotaxis protein
LEQSAQLVRRLAHDFGNVLTGILGFSELSLSILSPNSPGYQYVNEINQSAQQGAEFTQGLRWFSKRGIRGEHASAIADVVAAECHRLEQSGPAGMQVRVYSSGKPCLVAVETEALRVALRQVLNNAREALPAAGIITVTARPTVLDEAECRRLVGDARPGDFVEVSISDTGPGFTEEAKQKLFVEPFFSGKFRPRGLGLSIVYGILRNCQGGMHIEDRVDGGVSVRLFFPVVASNVDASPASTLPATQCDRVLVVDDDPGVLLLVCTTLTQAGYRVNGAANGAEALELYSAADSDGFALVLTDVLMPRISGIDLARRLLAQDASANVLLMSGEPTSGSDFDEPIHGRFDLLSKPFRPEGLLRAVRAALLRRSPVQKADVGRAIATPHGAST